MKTPSFHYNLLEVNWIPSIGPDDRTSRLSLKETFRNGLEIRDLACGPAERISLLRLLICIAQAAQTPPRRDDSAEWDSFARNLIPASLAYLERPEISAAFDLFGDGQRFLQLRTAKAESMAASKLFLHLASGNNPTHNDHGGGEERNFPPEDLALFLLTFQNFSPLIGRGFTGRGPCVEGNAAHVFQQGANLADTILANCLSLDRIEALCPEEGMGRPIWEMPPLPPFDQKTKETRNATRSYLGRLVPMARAVWLKDAANVILMSGPQFPDTPAGREPSTTVVVNKKQEHVLQGLRLHRAVWRDLPDFLASGATLGCPVLQRHRPGDREIFVGGIVTDFKAKVEDSVSSLFSGRLAVPGRLFGSEEEAVDARLDYAKAMKAADAWSISLWSALGGYFTTLKVEPKQITGFRDAAQARFWVHAERGLPHLFEMLRGKTSYPDDPLDHPYAKTDWHRCLREASAETYRLHAPRGTARQLEAFAYGLKFLWPKNPSRSKAA